MFPEGRAAGKEDWSINTRTKVVRGRAGQFSSIAYWAALPGQVEQAHCVKL